MLRCIACCLATLLPAQDPGAPDRTPDPDPAPADSSAAATKPPEPWPIAAPEGKWWYDEKRLLEIVGRLRPLAEKHAGLTFVQPPVVRAANDESWDRLIREEVPGARDRDVAATFAVYVPTRGEVVLGPYLTFHLLHSEGEKAAQSVFARPRLVHELVHVLQEQHFRLASRMRAAENSEEKTVLRSMLEGFATWVEYRFAGDDPELADYARDKAKTLARSRMEYLRGCDFFARLHESGGYEAMHDAMRNEPLKLHEFVRIALKKPPAAPSAATPPPPEGPAK